MPYYEKKLNLIIIDLLVKEFDDDFLENIKDEKKTIASDKIISQKVFFS